MDAVELLAKQDISKLMEYYGFEEMRYDGNKIRACCKIHGGNNPSAFVVDTETNYYFCHTGCGKGGDIFTLVMVMEDIGFIDAVKFVSNFYNVDITNMQIKEREKKQLREIQDFIRIVKKKRRKNLEEYLPRVVKKEVASFRKFKEETINYFGMFYASEIDIVKNGEVKTLVNKLYFPIKWDGKIIGALLRRTNEKERIKWNNQPEGIQTGDLLYNYDNALGKEEVIVVEGLLDVWAFHELGLTAVATFGAHLTKEQAYLLIKTGATIILCYDGDEAGELATKKAIEMLSNKADLFKITLNQGDDPECTSREELYERYANRKRV